MDFLRIYFLLISPFRRGCIESIINNIVSYYKLLILTREMVNYQKVFLSVALVFCLGFNPDRVNADEVSTSSNFEFHEIKPCISFELIRIHFRY